jgi:Holliday junction resolvase-like predicted endonuclease
VIEILSDYLKSQGYSIMQSLTTLQKGIDLIAENSEECLYIEAKGATSAREGSNRFGKEFNSAQVRTHISEAIFASLKVLNNKKTAKIKAAIALPASTLHIREIEKVKHILKEIGIKVFFVSSTMNETKIAAYPS